VLLGMVGEGKCLSHSPHYPTQGLGKTLIAITLILANPPAGVEYMVSVKQAVEPFLAQNTAGDMDVKKVEKVTLVMPNKTALKRVKTPILLRLLNEFSIPIVSTSKDSLVKAAHEALQSKKISVEEYYSGIEKPFEVTSAPSAARPTLIVCPVSVISNWSEQIASHVQLGALRVSIYQGSQRESLIQSLQLEQVDVVITSYNTLATDFTAAFLSPERGQPPVKRVKHGTIFDSNFHRVILDEAHIIRNMKTRSYKACAALKAVRKVCLTGTPLQNSPDDLKALFCFLKVQPLDNPMVYRRAITRPILNGEMDGLDRLRAMMAYIALRRNKSQIDFTLPEKTVEMRAVVFPKGPHKDIHDALFQSARGAFSATLQNGNDAPFKHYNSLLELILRIRQACCSGRMVPKERWQQAMRVVEDLEKRSKGKPVSADEGVALLAKLKGVFDEQESSCECCICLEDMQEDSAVILRTCLHVYCKTCLSKVASVGGGNCPLCRTPFSLKDMVQKSEANSAAAGESDKKRSSSVPSELGVAPKIQAMLEAIKEMKLDEKAIIFSQFTSYLDEIQFTMKDQGHKVTRIDGSLNTTKRTEVY
jgi:SWI/SNF-related matrix-associated actin-dependent regulator of chromatin subfamily A3